VGLPAFREPRRSPGQHRPGDRPEDPVKPAGSHAIRVVACPATIPLSTSQSPESMVEAWSVTGAARLVARPCSTSGIGGSSDGPYGGQTPPSSRWLGRPPHPSHPPPGCADSDRRRRSRTYPAFIRPYLDGRDPLRRGGSASLRVEGERNPLAGECRAVGTSARLVWSVLMPPPRSGRPWWEDASRGA